MNKLKDRRCNYLGCFSSENHTWKQQGFGGVVPESVLELAQQKCSFYFLEAQRALSIPK